MLTVIPSVTYKLFMLSVDILNVVMVSVVKLGVMCTQPPIGAIVSITGTLL